MAARAPAFRIPILAGPTASGKTDVVLALAEELGRVEIINADSLQVYRGMDIGTAKPSRAELERVPHHLIDIREPDEEFTAGDFLRETDRAISEIEGRGNFPVLVGGTGFYLKARLYGLWDAPPADPAVRGRLEHLTDAELYAELEKKDPESALRIGMNDRYRLVRSLEIMAQGGLSPSELRAREPASPDPRFELWVIDREGSELESRITRRTERMLEAGLLDETRGLVARYPGARALKAVGYAQCADFLAGRRPAGRKMAAGIEGLKAEINLATRQLVKKQRTWFRGEPASQWFHLDGDRDRLAARFRELHG